MRIGNILKIDIAPNRIFGLDILRAIAIGGVLYAHNLEYLNHIIPIEWSRWLMIDGVTIFFVLSGYLIGGILLKIISTKTFDFSALRTFWKRRWMRTLPNYFLILTLISIYHLLFRSLEGIPIWKYYLFIQNFNWAHPLFFEEAWSLSIEEWFYLIVPFGIFILLRFFKMDPKKAVFLCAVVILCFSTYMRWYKWNGTDIHKMHEWGVLIRTQILTRLDSLMFGIIAAIISFYHSNIWRKNKTWLLIAGILLFTIQSILFKSFGVSNTLMAVFSLSIISLATAMVLPYLSQLKSGKGIWFKLITYISLTSYSAYLINVSIVKSILLYNLSKFYPVLPKPIESMLSMVLFFSLTFIGSILLYKYFELPFMRLRDKK